MQRRLPTNSDNLLSRVSPNPPEMDIHPGLQEDCLVIGRFSLCYLLLMQDANYPWLILVPDRENITEIHHLCEADHQQLMRESVLLATAMEAVFAPDKLNIAALGNIVPQLHVHHIARYRNDPAWPAPVWGKTARKDYTDAERQDVLERLKNSLRGKLESVNTL